jgi:hypothetical protein
MPRKRTFESIEALAVDEDKAKGLCVPVGMHVMVGPELRLDDIEHHGQYRGGRRVDHVAVG